MEDILGVPALGYMCSKYKDNEIWQYLLQWDKNNFLVSATSSKTVTEDEGLVPSHGI